MTAETPYYVDGAAGLRGLPRAGGRQVGVRRHRAADDRRSVRPAHPRPQTAHRFEAGGSVPGAGAAGVGRRIEDLPQGGGRLLSMHDVMSCRRPATWTTGSWARRRSTVRQHQHHRHRRLRPPESPLPRQRRGQRRRLVLPADHRHHAPGTPQVRREGGLPDHPRLPDRPRAREPPASPPAPAPTGSSPSSASTASTRRPRRCSCSPSTRG